MHSGKKLHKPQDVTAAGVVQLEKYRGCRKCAAKV